MNDIDIDAVRQREQVILPGPWRVGEPTPTGPDLWELPILLDRAGPDGPETIQVCAVEYQTGGFHYPHADAKADAEFIAHARTDVPALLAKVDELTTALRRAENGLALADSGRIALLAKVDELTVALAAAREHDALKADQLVTANRRAQGLEADLRSANTANTAWANQGKPCLIVSCLECGEKYEYDGGVVHFSALDEAQSMTEDDDWRRVGDQFVCDGCVHEPHTFKADGLDVLTCQRCDLEEDDHETAPAVPATAEATR